MVELGIEIMNKMMMMRMRMVQVQMTEEVVGRV
jgi:hypothetical protein